MRQSNIQHVTWKIRTNFRDGCPEIGVFFLNHWRQADQSQGNQVVHNNDRSNIFYSDPTENSIKFQRLRENRRDISYMV